MMSDKRRPGQWFRPVCSGSWIWMQAKVRVYRRKHLLSGQQLHKEQLNGEDTYRLREGEVLYWERS
jgi:hypothetical protein